MHIVIILVFGLGDGLMWKSKQSKLGKKPKQNKLTNNNYGIAVLKLIVTIYYD